MRKEDTQMTRLRAERLRRGWTQADLARHARVSARMQCGVKLVYRFGQLADLRSVAQLTRRTKGIKVPAASLPDLRTLLLPSSLTLESMSGSMFALRGSNASEPGRTAASKPMHMIRTRARFTFIKPEPKKVRRTVAQRGHGEC
jgi:transcriptional regulator with XRE-family HTH domain